MKTKKQFSQVPTQFNFVENEEKLLDWWYKSGLVDKYLSKNNESKKRFSFLDGPLTANNPMGVHHAWGRTIKDIYQRYKNMQGFAQRFQNGFDCQGLWVEVEVEKEKGFKNKKDIENYGIDKFVADCKARVDKYSKIQTEQSKRLGYFMDWNHSYYTMSDENNYTIWHFLKRCFEDGNIYKGTDSVPWCPRCGTSLSQHEIVTEGYKQLTHQSVFMKFPVVKNGKQQKNEYLLVWTTTPWTVPADTLVALHPEIKYALVEKSGEKFWLAESLVEKIFGEKLDPLKVKNGKELIEKEKITHYKAAFDDLPIIKEVGKSNHFHSVVLAKDLVNEEEGTGLVHIVPGAGTEDHRLVKNDFKWPEVIFSVVGQDGSYLEGYGFLTGKSAKDHPELVIDYLKEKESGRFLFKTEPFTHAYPVCWRCSTELIWRIVDEWYIGMDNPRKSDGKTLRERMKAVAKKINWIPGFGLKRELDWLDNMHDWLISKKRYWGLALPIWECKCGHFEIIGSKDELKDKATAGWKKFEGHTPHRPEIDQIKIKCPKCKKLANRVADVGTPWLDAGIVSFSTLTDPKTGKVSYLGDQKYWKKWFPTDFVTECFPGQFRNWFYSLIAMSTALEDQIPFKTLLGHALVRDEKGEEMHKSKGNAIMFEDAASKMSVDTMRWLYTRQDPEHNLNLSYKLTDEVRRQFIFLYWNTYRFFVTYANLNNWQPGKAEIGSSSSPLDKWILSRLESTKKEVEEKMDKFLHHKAILEIEKFLEDLSLVYVRGSRERLSPTNSNKKEREVGLGTLYHSLNQLTLILTPFIPFLTETVWQNLNDGELRIENSVHLQNWPITNKNLIDKDLEKTMDIAREVVTAAHSQRKEAEIKVRQPLNSLASKYADTLKKAGLDDYVKNEVNVKNLIEGKEIALDLKITDSLKSEGEARELTRNIQIARKKAGLSLDDKIIATAPDWPEKWENEIKLKTGTVEIKKGDELSIKKAN